MGNWALNPEVLFCVGRFVSVEAMFASARRIGVARSVWPCGCSIWRRGGQKQEVTLFVMGKHASAFTSR